MTSRLRFVLSVSLLLMGAMPVVAGAQTPITWLRDPDQVPGEVVPGAYATLRRDADAIAMTIHTSTCRPRQAYTVWWVIFNYPDQCAAPFQCTGAADFANPAVQASVMWAAGNVVDRNGDSDFQGELRVGEYWGCQPAEVGFPCNELLNPLGAEVHLVIRSHGQVLPGYLGDQIGSFAGGCDGPAPPFLAGGNECFDAQSARRVP